MDYKLSAGAVAALMQGNMVEKPVFQILGFKKIGGQGNSGSDRFRLNISDGLHTHTFAMLATQLNPMITKGELDNMCIIRAEKLVSNTVSDAKKVLIILEITVIAKGSTVREKIGNPVQFNEAAASAAGATYSESNIKVKTEPTKTANAFYGSKATPAPTAPSPVRQNNNANNSSFSAKDNFLPIRDINPYNTKCSIKARVTSKSAIRTWSNPRGEGKLFNIDLLDDSGEIRMTGFNTAVDTFYEMIKVNDVYTFSKVVVKTANRQFCTLNHDYELNFSNETQVMPCLDSDTGEIPTMSFNFLEIAFIGDCEVNKIIDVIGVCTKRGDLGTVITKKDNKELRKREITLIDRTNTEVALTLWGKQAEDFEDDSNPVVAVKGAKVGEFNGKNLSVMGTSTVMINPDLQEAHVLRGWYDNEGMHVEAKSLGGQRGPGGAGGPAPWKLLREANGFDVSSAENGYFFKSKVMVMAIKRDSALYKACPEEKCNKKVVDSGTGMYRCEKCAKDHTDFKWRVILQTNLGDCTDAIWATCFQEHGELILGDKAEILGGLFQDNPDSFDGIIKQAVFKNYTAKIKGKLETYNNENRIKYTVMDLQPINYTEYARELVNQIKETMN